MDSQMKKVRFNLDKNTYHYYDQSETMIKSILYNEDKKYSVIRLGIYKKHTKFCTMLETILE